MEKYTLNLDDNNYVLSIAHTQSDDIELDLSKYDLTYLSAYQYINGELVLDEAKKEELIAQMQEQEAKANEPSEQEKINAQLMLEIAMIKAGV